MKQLVFRILAIVIGMTALGCSIAGAQSLKEIEKDELAAFSAITLGGDFTLELHDGDEYAAKVTTEEMLAEYIRFTVADGTLTVTLDERNVPAEVKRLFRGKNAATYRLEVTMPAALKRLTLNDKAILLTADDDVVSAEGLDIVMKDNARIAGFGISTGRVSFRMERKAEATVEVRCDSLDVQMSGSSSLTLKQEVRRAGYVLSYNASLVVDGEASERMGVQTKGTAKAILNGRAPVVDYKVTNASNVNAVNLECEEAHAEMSGLCTLTQAAGRDLFVNIGSGATLVFLNEPSFHILGIKNASVTPYDKKK